MPAVEEEEEAASLQLLFRKFLFTSRSFPKRFDDSFFTKAMKKPITVQAFTGTYGINYGRIADNIPSPDEVVTLLRAAKIRNVRIYDADHSVLKAFSGSGLELVPLLEFFSQIGSPFCLNAYPFLAYMSDPENIDINYALFQKTQGIYDPKTDLHYDNMLDAQIDAAYAALEDAGFKKMEVIITETGWASHGDDNEAEATADNARMYNYNLRKRLAKKKGTPLRPKIVVKAYIFAIFNEDLKPGPTSERNIGLFKPDGSISYDIGFDGLKSSSADSSLLSMKVRGLDHQ
ncbi:hypothetical protein GH714_015823 [Hevea brasiliensis]|uniref:glucan endo-1,3-beta-D-glucosidase n=1 Tax=Hevea brasiliensis TaxID=3981 RepID=A0A6A6MBJ6_HEVBR|nr:hypothetical protein GH714_015823 [Hevea brasiliensis]